MVSADESRQGLIMLADAAAATASEVASKLSGSADQMRSQAFATIPGLIDYYALGTAAFAADVYDTMREQSNPRTSYRAEPVVPDRAEKIGNAVAWATAPLYETQTDLTQSEVDRRFQVIVSGEVKRPYQVTTLTNVTRDPHAAGYMRVASASACGFCRLVASKGAIYRESSAYFAAHDHCSCTACAVFKGGETGPEASVLQYVASGRKRTAKEKADLRDAIAHFEGH